MIPVPIPADYQLAPNQRRLIVGPPDNDLTGDIRALEAIFEVVVDARGTQRRFHVLMEIEPSDWDHWGIAPPPRPARFWMLQIGAQMAAFALTAEPTPGLPERTVHLVADEQGLWRCPLCHRLCTLEYLLGEHVELHRYTVDGHQHAELEVTVVATIRDRYTQGAPR